MSLNSAQQTAVAAPLKSLLILAGAGSGKTRVLVHRIAWLIEQNQVTPQQILAVTFTNKAAGEMRSRLQKLLKVDISGMWVGTFHGLAYKFLRIHWREAGLPQYFQVIDSDEQVRIIKKIGKNLNLHDEEWEPKKAQSWINKVKDEGRRSNNIPNSYFREPWLATLYRQYEHACIENGWLDFAEIMLRCTELFGQNSEVIEHYHRRFGHFLVDEFQDTNEIQYKWLRYLAKKANSVTVVGDDDQSIYGWRGAKVENIARFEREYPEVETVRLEQNYRSTKNILKAANHLIKNNSNRMGKTLWTDEINGELITVKAADNEEQEARDIVRKVQNNLNKGVECADIGILYRSNAQSRVLEEVFVKSGIPYTIYGGLRFFERAEIKDALAYLRLMVNTQDNAAFERIINTPPRGIGGRSLEKMIDYANAENISYWQAAEVFVATKGLPSKAHQGLVSFIEMIKTLEELSKTFSLTDLIAKLIEISGLIAYFKSQKGEQALSRTENLEELVSAVKDFEAEYWEENDASPLISFLSYAILEAGEHKKTSLPNCVQMMTLHAAKGLEFKVAFICGLEERLFPHHFCTKNPSALEEERRLCYVGITRAKELLYLSYAKRRRMFGREEARLPSRFLDELPKDCLLREKTALQVFRADAFQDLDFDDDTSELAIGRRVCHKRFGTGIIRQLDGQGDKARVEVDFEKKGRKWLLQSYANLEII